MAKHLYIQFMVQFDDFIQRGPTYDVSDFTLGEFEQMIERAMSIEELPDYQSSGNSMVMGFEITYAEEILRSRRVWGPEASRIHLLGRDCCPQPRLY